MNPHLREHLRQLERRRAEPGTVCRMFFAGSDDTGEGWVEYDAHGNQRELPIDEAKALARDPRMIRLPWADGGKA